MMKKVFMLCSALLLMTVSTQAGILIDFDEAGGPSAGVGIITVVVDIATDGSATLNSISGTATAQPDAIVSGSVAAPDAAYQVTLVVGPGGRQTGIGLVGVGNNHIDPGETMTFDLDVDAAPAGTVYYVPEIEILSDENGGLADGTITGGTSGSLAFSGLGNSRTAFDTSGLGTSVAQASGLTNSINLNGGTTGRYQLCALTIDVVPEPATLVLLGLGSLIGLKRRR